MALNYGSIVLSGLPVSGKSSLVNGLLETSELSRWQFHSIGDLVKARHKEEYPNPKTRIPLSKWWADLSEAEQIGFNEDLFELARNGKIIADTRYALICRDGNILYQKTGNSKYQNVNLDSLLVFLEAPIDIRVERGLGREDYFGKTRDEVRAELLQREENELRLGREIFGINYQNRTDYDLVLDSSRMTPEEEVSAVMSLMRK